jgi:hypothetical protein
VSRVSLPSAVALSWKNKQATRSEMDCTHTLDEWQRERLGRVRSSARTSYPPGHLNIQNFSASTDSDAAMGTAGFVRLPPPDETRCAYGNKHG